MASRSAAKDADQGESQSKLRLTKMVVAWVLSPSLREVESAPRRRPARPSRREAARDGPKPGRRLRIQGLGVEADDERRQRDAAAVDDHAASSGRNPTSNPFSLPKDVNGMTRKRDDQRSDVSKPADPLKSPVSIWIKTGCEMLGQEVRDDAVLDDDDGRSSQRILQAISRVDQGLRRHLFAEEDDLQGTWYNRCQTVR